MAVAEPSLGCQAPARLQSLGCLSEEQRVEGCMRYIREACTGQAIESGRHVGWPTGAPRFEAMLTDGLAGLRDFAAEGRSEPRPRLTQLVPQG